MSEPIEELHRRGRAHFAELVEGGEQRLDALFATVPGLGELAVGTVYGHLHDRPALDGRTREAVTLSAIVAAGMTGPPLAVHLRTGLAAGLAPAEIGEVVVQTAAFAGFPRAVTAADRLNQLFAEQGLPSPPPAAPREVVLAFCARVAAGERDAVAPEVLAALAEFPRAEVHATGPDRVIVECFGESAAAGAVLSCRVEAGVVTAVTAYRPG